MANLHIDKTRCKGCGYCVDACPKKALTFNDELGDQGYNVVQFDETLCVQCGACYRVCPDYVFELF